MDGTDLQSTPDTDTGDGCDTRTHTYRWTYTPARTGRVGLAVWDPTTPADDGRQWSSDPTFDSRQPQAQVVTALRRDGQAGPPTSSGTGRPPGTG